MDNYQEVASIVADKIEIKMDEKTCSWYWYIAPEYASDCGFNLPSGQIFEPHMTPKELTDIYHKIATEPGSKIDDACSAKFATERLALRFALGWIKRNVPGWFVAAEKQVHEANIYRKQQRMLAEGMDGQ